MTTLVIGYGNEDRGDDGAGPGVARRIEASHLPGVEVIVLHQLMPELAERLAEIDQAVFVDATVRTQVEPVQLQPLVPSQDSIASSHGWTPASLLQLAVMLYERSPRAWILAIAGENFEPGDTMSEKTRIGIQHAVFLLEGLLDPQLESRKIGPTGGD